MPELRANIVKCQTNVISQWDQIHQRSTHNLVIDWMRSKGGKDFFMIPLCTVYNFLNLHLHLSPHPNYPFRFLQWIRNTVWRTILYIESSKQFRVFYISISSSKQLGNRYAQIWERERGRLGDIKNYSTIKLNKRGTTNITNININSAIVSNSTNSDLLHYSIKV